MIMKKNVLEATATLVGCTIGAGILGIPYVVSTSGFLTGVVDIVLIGILMLVAHLYLGEVVLRTKGNHQLTGYAKKYTGKLGRFFMIIYMVFAIYGAMTAYLIMSGEFLGLLLNGSPFFYSMLVFAIMAIMIYLGLEVIEKSELVMMFLFIGVLFVIVALCLPSVNINNLKGLNISNFFIPYGVVLFAFLGEVAIPEMVEELRENRKELRKSIIIGGLIPIVIYILFSLAIVGVSGVNTSKDSMTGLIHFINPVVVKVGMIFGILTMLTSFLALGLALKEMFIYDFKLEKILAWFLTMFVPLFIFVSGVRNFIEVLSVTGALTGGVVGVLIVLMHRNASLKGDRKPEFVIKQNLIVDVLLILLFAFGIIHQFLTLFGIIKV